MSHSVFDLKAVANDGTEKDLGDYRGKVLVIVNTASKCGFTPQYAGLESLYQKYADKGLVVLGFPCDQFAHQEPGGDAEIATFCQRNFGVTFPLMSKVDVNGPGAHPVFAMLRKQAPGVIGDAVKWNFTKFLVSKDGKAVKRFAPTYEPEKMERDIVEALEA
ncbi:MAG: glutathione peroxidase [Spirochaetae bacterium HGW-Spirochaetae-3]|jgi:glutathione peroxidase|nr:MAG: glutathione peroxidase [Spirochaetae bacterium HGW-Spirochaetae-3]